MRKIYIAGLALISFVVACFAADKRRVLLIPLDPFEQKVSERMRQQISALKEEGALSALGSWKTLAELPDWVFVEKEREILYIFGRPGVSDDYRYAVVLSRKTLIVVRAGGIAGIYEIFVKPQKPNQISQRKAMVRPVSVCDRRSSRGSP
jgi:hypothetical protein